MWVNRNVSQPIVRSLSSQDVLLRSGHESHLTIMFEVLVLSLQAQRVDLSIGAIHQQVSILCLCHCCYYFVVVRAVLSEMGIHDLLEELDQLSGC